MNSKYLALYLILAAAGVLPPVHVQAQTTSCTSTNLTENFTGLSTACTWNWVGGACLTAAPASTATFDRHARPTAAMRGIGLLRQPEADRRQQWQPKFHA